MNDVQSAYNGFGQLTTKYQSHSGAVNVSSTPNVQYAYANGSANTVRPASLTYPNGRVLTYNYGAAQGTNDAGSRIASLIDNDGITHLADYSYLGAGTIVQVNEPQPAIQYTLIGIQGGNDPVTGDIYRGLDLFSRVKDLVWVPSGSSSSSSSSSTAAGTNLVRIQHGYDRAGNRLWRKDLVAESFNAGLDELYGYDGLYRLRFVNRGTLNSTQTAIQPGTGTFNQCWTSDSTGNWKGFREDDTGNGTWNLVQSRSANTVNEITNITNSTGSAWSQPAYDHAGNMTSIPKPTAMQSGYTGAYDAWNRLVKLVDATSGQTVQTNSYDGRNYRILRGTYTGGTLTETRHYFFTSDWQSIEERVGASSNPNRQFVWGLRFLDDLILRDRDTTGGGTLNERLYAMQDPLGSVVAVANASGVVQERYAYAPYGAPEFLTAAFVAQSASNFDWETLIAGYRFDRSTALYGVRNRIFHSMLGSWLSRDLVPQRKSPNLYSYANFDPVDHTDPLGLDPSCCDRCNEAKKSIETKINAGDNKCQVNITCKRNADLGENIVAVTKPPDPEKGKKAGGWIINVTVECNAQKAYEPFLLILVHEMVHARQFCKRAPDNAAILQKCEEIEQEAYAVSCPLAFGVLSPLFGPCIECGIATSCGKEKPPGCTNALLGLRPPPERAGALDARSTLLLAPLGAA